MEVSVPSPYWQIFDKTYYKDESTTQYEYVQYKDRNVNVSTLSEYNLINQDLDVPLAMGDSFLQVVCYITNGNPGNDPAALALANDSDIAFNNNGWNIFQRAQYYMNDQLIEDIDEVGVTTLCKNLIDFSKAYSESACNELWEIDTLNNSPVFPLRTNITGVGIRDTSILAGGVLAAGGGANDTVVSFHWNGADIQTVLDDGVVAQALAINGGAQHIDFGGAPGAGVVAANRRIALRTNAARPNTELELFIPGTGRGVLIPVWLTGDGTDLVIVHLDTNLLPLAVPAVAAGNLYARIKKDHNPPNKGYYERKNRTLSNVNGITPNKAVNLFLPINRIFKIFDYNRHIFRGVKHQIKLYKNLNNKTLFMRGPTTANGTLWINDISWWVPTLRGSIETTLKLDKELNSSMKTKLQWNQIRTFVSPQQPAATGIGNQGYWRMTSAGNKPIRIFVVFRIEEQYSPSNGPQNGYNAMLFKHMDISNIHVRINSLQFPKEEFITDFINTDDYLRVYLQFLQVSGHIMDPSGGGYSVCYDEFKDLYPIFCFDLSKQDPAIWANITQAELELRYRRTPGGEYAGNAFTIYAIVEFEKNISLVGVDNRLRIDM